MRYHGGAMNEKTRQGLRVRLERLKEGLVASGPAKFEPTRKDDAAVGVPDEDEQALTEMLQILASSQNRKQSEELGLIDRALRKLAEAPGDYGMCEECDEPIAPRRLELMPYATLCTECQSARDPRRGKSRKSLTDFGS
jgi:DnaK suppressor protein